MHYLSVVLFAGTHEIHSPVLFDSVPRPLKLLEMWGRLESILSSISKKAHQISSYCPFPDCIWNSREICPRVLHELCTILSKYDKSVLSSVPTYCRYLDAKAALTWIGSEAKNATHAQLMTVKVKIFTLSRTFSQVMLGLKAENTFHIRSTVDFHCRVIFTCVRT